MIIALKVKISADDSLFSLFLVFTKLMNKKNAVKTNGNVFTHNPIIPEYDCV